MLITTVCFALGFYGTTGCSIRLLGQLERSNIDRLWLRTGEYYTARDAESLPW